ncbi:MAG TPA: GyrI-like domain-containing protein [Acidobacteriota bacterium]|nr:GyrI-like domain-containing protein [Acidobacteriota bacterium]
MKRISVGTIVAATLLAGLASGALAAPQDLTVTIKEVKPFPYCAISHKGPYTDMGTVIGELVGAMQAQGLFARIRGPMIGVYFNSPAATPPEELSWEAGFIVEAQTTTRPPLMKKDWAYRTVAAAVSVGPYEKSGAAIGTIMAWIAAQGYEADGPVLERYLDQNPESVKPEELRTEIWIPCRKR